MQQKSSGLTRLPETGREKVNAKHQRSNCVVLADDDPVILEQIASLLQPHFKVVGRAADGRQLVRLVNKLSPDIVIADITMPEMNGIEAAERIRKTHPKVKVLMLSGCSYAALIDGARCAGAVGYVFKLDAFTELLPALHQILSGKEYWPDV